MHAFQLSGPRRGALEALRKLVGDLEAKSVADDNQRPFHITGAGKHEFVEKAALPGHALDVAGLAPLIFRGVHPATVRLGQKPVDVYALDPCGEVLKLVGHAAGHIERRLAAAVEFRAE